MQPLNSKLCAPASTCFKASKHIWIYGYLQYLGMLYHSQRWINQAAHTRELPELCGDSYFIARELKWIYRNISALDSECHVWPMQLALKWILKEERCLTGHAIAWDELLKFAYLIKGTDFSLHCEFLLYSASLKVKLLIFKTGLGADILGSSTRRSRCKDIYRRLHECLRTTLLQIQHAIKITNTDITVRCFEH